MKKIIVTGATSMLGIALIRQCVKNQVSVLALIRKDSEKRRLIPQSDLIDIYECKLQELEKLELPVGEYDCFYHFAWAHTEREERDNPTLQALNIRYCMDAVKLAYRAGCHKFIGAGSQAEYGHVNSKIYPITRVEPMTAYGVVKYAAGKLSRKLCDEMNMIHIWGRIFSVYGPHDRDDSMISYAIHQIKNNELAEFSHGMQMWNYLYEDDAGEIFFKLGEFVNQSKTYCIGSVNSKPLKDYIMELSEVFGGRLKCKFAELCSDELCYGIQPDVTDLWSDIGDIDETPFGDGIRAVWYGRQIGK